MCASYSSTSEFNIIQTTYKVEFPSLLSLPQKIIYPHTVAPVILQTEAGRTAQLMNYSLIPSWSKVRKPKFATYNARIEEVLNKPSWKEPFKNNHCLVPIVEFYESAYSGIFEGSRFSIAEKSGALLTAAGIWDLWKDAKTGQWITSFAILTTEPNAQIIEAGHDRSPLFLPETAFDEWLEGKKTGDDWVSFLQNKRQIDEYKFEKVSDLKAYQNQGQLKLFKD